MQFKRNLSTVLDFNARDKEILDLTQYWDRFKKKRPNQLVS